MKTRAFAVAFLLTMFCSTMLAQDHRWTFNAGGGFSPLLGDLDNRLNNGWNVMGGAGYNFASGLSATVNYTFSNFSISQRVLKGAGESSGKAHLWSLTVDPRLPLRYVGKFRPYLVGGVGYYRLSVANFALRSSQASADNTHSGPGGSLGLGFDVNVGDTGFMVFGEARYHYASTGSVTTHMIPLTVGIRW